jgi:hypothetical protein
VRLLVVLALLLAGAFGVFLTRGLGQVERLRTAHAELAARRAHLTEQERTIARVPYDEFAALSRRRARAAALLDYRRKILADASLAAPAPDFDTLLSGSVVPALRSPSPLADGLRAQAALSPEARTSLAAILAALPREEGLDLELLQLEDEGRPRALAGMLEVRAQLVVVGAPGGALACLEALAVDRGHGLPAPSVLSASLRRIEPARWGPHLHRLEAPPVRLSVSLSVLLPSDRSGGT